MEGRAFRTEEGKTPAEMRQWGMETKTPDALSAALIRLATPRFTLFLSVVLALMVVVAWLLPGSTTIEVLWGLLTLEKK